MKDAIEDTHRMGLHAMEIQFLRVNVQERSVYEEVGLTPREVEESLIIEVLRPDDEGNYKPVGINTPLEEDDIVFELSGTWRQTTRNWRRWEIWPRNWTFN